jgi:hypothetical protein
MIGAKGLFGKRQPWMTPGIGDGLPNASMPQDMAAQDGANLGMASPQKRGGGFFGQGGAGRAIAGSIGDALLQQSGMAPIYAPQMQFQQAMAARQAEEQRRRAAELADYRTKLGIEQEFKTPEAPKPGSFEWFQNADPQQRAQYGEYRDVGDDDEFVVVPIPGRGTYAGPRSGLPSVFGQGGGQEAPDMLPSDFFKGGSGGNAGGNFRP